MSPWLPPLELYSFGDHLIQVEQHIQHGRGRGVVDDVELLVAGVFAGADEFLGGGFVVAVLAEDAFVARDEDAGLLGGGLTGRRLAEGGAQAHIDARVLLDQSLGPDAGGFDERHVVEQDERVQR